MQIVPPDIDINFMKGTRLAGTISTVVVVAALASILLLGLNLGIDFKGGTKIIAAFEAGADDVDRDKIREVVRDLANEHLGTRDVQVEVQDFFSGGIGEGEMIRFQVLTELTSFLSDDRRGGIEAQLRKTFGKRLRNLVVVQEGEDKFYVHLAEKEPVPQTVEAITKAFVDNGVKEIKITSSFERQLDVEFYRELNLQVKEGADELTVQQLMEAHAKEKAERTAKAKDSEFEVRVEELKGYLETAFQKTFTGSFKEVESFTSISASVGRELFNTGLLAILYAIIGILIYIWLRFDIRYSPGAVVALLHDVIITLGVFSVLQIKFTLPIIAALLTIVGYSLNDTIVVYDRIRENISRVRQRAMVETVNRAINECLSRTLLTSLTTLFVVLCLLVFGGGLIQDFALALTIGIVVGTYSSMYVASPVVVFLDRIVEAKKVEQRSAPETA